MSASRERKKRMELAAEGMSPKQLRQAAEIRLEYPELNLKELGEMLDPPVGKSGINHRLRKLQELAEELRKE